MIARLLGAIQFLTTLPVRGSTAPPGKCALFFPLIGGALGAAGAYALLGLREFIPWTLAALLVLGSWSLLTGGLHEDGFADVADAFRAGRPPERIFAILKDSRIGAHGAVALILMTLVRWQALSAIAVDPIRSLAAVFAISRAAMVAAAWTTPPAGTGLGLEFSRCLNTAGSLFAIVTGLLFAALAPAGLLLVWVGTVVVFGGRAYFMRRIGGVNGDCLGAISLLVETCGLVVLTCQRCI
jgi:adenosylcobinamide-GDP ribazoletransferase